MKKIALLLITICSALLLFSGCANAVNLEDYVSDLRSDVYFGQSENFCVKGGYGFKEEPFVNNGKVGEVKNSLFFKLVDKESDDATYSMSIRLGDKTFTSDFKFNPITHSLIASLEVDDFAAKEFTINIICSSSSEEVVMKSLLPQNTINYTSALKSLKTKQSALLDSLRASDGTLNAELYLRVLVKDDKPYWYVGIATGNEGLKALLIDGINGEILAVREIF